MFDETVRRKRKVFTAQATHTDGKDLFKFVNGSLYILRDVTLWAGRVIAYPVWSKSNTTNELRKFNGY